MLTAAIDDNGFQKTICHTSIDIFLNDDSEIDIWGKTYKVKQLRSWFAGIIASDDCKITIASTSSSSVLSGINNDGFITRSEKEITWDESRMWFPYNSQIIDSMRDIGLRVESKGSYRKYVYAKHFMEHSGFYDFLREKGIDVLRFRFYHKSLKDLNLLDSWRDHWLSKEGSEVECFFDLGYMGRTLNPVYDQIYIDARRSVSKSSRRGLPSVPDKIKLAVAEKQYWVPLIPENAFSYRDNFIRQLVLKKIFKDKAPAHVKRQVRYVCDIKDIDEDTRDEFDNFSASLEHVFDHAVLHRLGFNGNFIENLRWYGHKYNCNLPNWGVDNGLSKTRAIIQDGVMLKDEVIETYREILGCLIQQTKYGVKGTDKIRAFFKQVESLIDTINEEF